MVGKGEKKNINLVSKVLQVEKQLCPLPSNPWELFLSELLLAIAAVENRRGNKITTLGKMDNILGNFTKILQLLTAS